jgi:predicted nucleic acid-binding protein
MPVVLDVSATLSWLIADERDDEAIAMAEAVLTRSAIVPVLWRLELRNALLTAERRGRITVAQSDELVNDLRGLPIEISPDAFGLGDETELALARKYDLSVYDAAYLAIAVRNAAPLMTRDAQLGPAAEDLHLRWHPDPR